MTAQLTRRGKRARDPVWQRSYYWLYGTALVIALGVPPLSQFAAWLFGGSGMAVPSLGLALLLAFVAGLIMLLTWAGPIVVSPADVRWLILSPRDRRETLTRSALVLLVVMVVAGLILGTVGVAVLGAPQALIPGVAAGLAVTIGLGSASVLLQRDETARGLPRLVAALLMGTAGLLVWLRPGLPEPSTTLAWLILAAALLLAWRAWRGLGRLPARVLADAAGRVGVAAGASLGLEPALLTSIAEQRHWRGRRLRSRPWPAAGRTGLIARSDLRMLSRRPGRLAVLGALMALPAAIHLSGGTAGVAVLALLAGGLVAACTASAGARWDAQHPELARLFAPGGLAARAIVPSILAALWSLLAWSCLALVGAVPATHLLYGPAAAPSLAAGALRMARRPPINHAMPGVDLGFGALPTGLLLWAAAGVDLALLGAAPLLLGMSPLVQLLWGALVLGGYLLPARSAVSRTR